MTGLGRRGIRLGSLGYSVLKELGRLDCWAPGLGVVVLIASLRSRLSYGLLRYGLLRYG